MFQFTGYYGRINAIGDYTCILPCILQCCSVWVLSVTKREALYLGKVRHHLHGDVDLP